MSKKTNRCNAKLHHGPGHQSRTRCILSGPHTVHECEYRREGGKSVARWRGDDVSTGFFNEPPAETDELAEIRDLEQLSALLESYKKFMTALGELTRALGAYDAATDSSDEECALVGTDHWDNLLAAVRAVVNCDPLGTD